MNKELTSFVGVVSALKIVPLINKNAQRTSTFGCEVIRPSKIGGVQVTAAKITPKK